MSTEVPNKKKKGIPPSAEEIEARRKQKQFEVIPEGMTKSEWKRQLKQKKWEETKEQYREFQREKKRLQRQRRKERNKQEAEEEEENYHQAKKPSRLPRNQIPTGVTFVMDCDFDDLMNRREIVSMSNQISRCYSAMRHCKYDVGLKITSFNKTLKERFDKDVSQYKLWKGIELNSEQSVEDLINDENRSKFVYLTADTDEEITELLPDHTYIIGGIVDKNRHKELCLNKAKKLGLKVGKLPIGKYIDMNGRHVLATSHVYELCCKWFENDKDWSQAFNEVLPPRKVKGKVDADGTVTIESEDVEESKDTTPSEVPV
ncbi:TRM10 [[Candida] subhashii]|uniref:tRNA (guanine(9)-N1)-methyltransferase n=1 Tax=[Candida] subhashii TaxID=561895 RepID=A0A8J5UEF6_9ASCO|nr:TRM10 [[Candida] subhashii]KAG7661113.1 TRM10 [[Candida] subhashii]